MKRGFPLAGVIFAWMRTNPCRWLFRHLGLRGCRAVAGKGELHLHQAQLI